MSFNKVGFVVAAQRITGGVNDDLKQQFDEAALQTNQALAQIRAAQGRGDDEEDSHASHACDDVTGEKVSKRT